MTWDEWEAITLKLSASYPDQPISAATAREWFDDLEPFDAGQVWLAVRTIRREETFRPGLAVLLAGIELHRRDLAAAHRAQLTASNASNGHRGGAPIPPETREALAILDEAANPDSGIDRDQAAAMIGTLGHQLEARIATSPETARDATRVCPECATSATEGFCDFTNDDGRGDDVLVRVPCPTCRPGRYQAWKQGLAHLKVDAHGYPLAVSHAQTTR